MMGGVTAARMTWVCTELLALWVVLPVLLWTDALPAVYRISVLVAAAVYALWVVRLERVRWDELGFRGLVGFLPSFLQGSLWIAVAVPVLFVAAALLHGEVGSLGRARPESLLALPLFSPGFLVGLNAVVFAVAHLVYASWVSILLALAGRVIMARIYRRHGSFWGVWLVHLLFGVAVFLVGLGRYFYRSVG